MDKVIDQLVHRADRLLPETGNVADEKPLGDPSLLPHHLVDATEFRGHALVHVHHLVEGIGHPARNAGPFHGQANAMLSTLQRMQCVQQHCHLFLFHRILL